MCQDCWREIGSPSTVNDRVKAAVELIARVYDEHDCGGGLHIIVDDWNLEDGAIAFCEDFIEKPEYRMDRNQNVTIERLKAERSCLRALKDMTQEERASALAVYKGYAV